ncbi:MAG: hypothetical protein GF384_04645, partial [Elusimicrobia bacterium]|nr:hypothetical protein [Elusimicrobiota bacterium]
MFDKHQEYTSPHIHPYVDDQTGLTKGFFSRLIKLFDWILFIAMGLLIVIGFLAVYSAASRFGHPGLYYGKQVLAVLFGSIAFLVFLLINYRIFQQYSIAVYSASLILLGGVLIWGDPVRGSRSWYQFHFLSFQPVEIAKVLIIFVLATYLDKTWNQMRNFRSTVVSLLIIGVHIGLILLQPDFSSTLVYFPIFFGMLYMAGAQVSHLLVYVIFGGIMAGLPLLRTFLKLQPDLLKSTQWLNLLYQGL